MRQATDEEVVSLEYSVPFQNGSLSLFYTSLDDEFIQIAKATLVDSTDQRHPTSAVVVKDGKVLSKGANQSGYKHALLIKWHQTWLCVRRWFKVKSGTKYWLCPGCAKSYDHAESRAARQVVRNNEEARGATLYLYGHWWCCKPCCDEMIKAGITKVVLLENGKETFLGSKELYRAK